MKAEAAVSRLPAALNDLLNLVKSSQQLPTNLMGVGCLGFVAKWVLQVAGRAARLLRTNI